MTAHYLGVDDVGERLGIKRSRVYELAAAGVIPCLRLGRRVYFPRAGIEAMDQAVIDRAIAVQRQQAERLSGRDELPGAA